MQEDWDAFVKKAKTYQEGNGVERNLEEGVKWYRMAAEEGDVDAQCNLGWCYEEGKGVQQDVAEAIRWYQKAAKQGDEDAQERLKKLGVGD